LLHEHERNCNQKKAYLYIVHFAIRRRICNPSQQQNQLLKLLQRWGEKGHARTRKMTPEITVVYQSLLMPMNWRRIVRDAHPPPRKLCRAQEYLLQTQTVN
jgi:hypothetical protein